MKLKRFSSKIIFLMSILAQGIYSAKANEYAFLQRWINKQSISPVKSEIRTTILQDKSEVTITELKPITITELDELVQSNNLTLKKAESDVNQAKSLLKAALSAWYPTINLSANGLPEYLLVDSYRNPDFTTNTKVNSKTGKTEPDPYSNSKQWNAQLAIRLKWNIIDPKRIPEIAFARDSFEQAKKSYLITLRDVQLEALNKYLLLQRADEGVRIGQQSIRASISSLKDAKARYEAGVANRLEVLEAETQLARDKQLLTQKLGDQKIQRRSLARLIKLPSRITPTAASPTKVLGVWQTSLEESIISAYEYREELDNALLEISKNNNKANSELGSIQPSLNLYNNFTYSRVQGQLNIPSNSKVDMKDYGWSSSNEVGLNANWNIFDGGRAKALYKYNKERANQASTDFESIKDRIREEVEESFFKLQTSTENISTAAREVIAARESLRLARLRFKAGVTNQREVVNNQRDLTRAEVNYTDAITQYNTSLSSLRRRTGIDHVKTCKPQEIKTGNILQDQFIDIPIEPMPIIPACNASTVDPNNGK